MTTLMSIVSEKIAFMRALLGGVSGPMGGVIVSKITIT